MRFPCWAWWIFLALSSYLPAAQVPANIPAPRPAAWVVDLAGVLAPGDVTASNALGDAVHAREGAVLAVVVIPSTGGRDARSFASDLFNGWQLGARGRDNGLLLFVALDDRAAEIILGDGIDSDVNVAASERIMRDVIVPRMREGATSDGIAAGTRACAERFFGVRTPGAAPDPALAEPLEAEQAVRTPAPARSSSGVPRAVGWGIGAAGAFLVGGAGWWGARAVMRKRPRRCAHCAMTMQRLDEAADDAHLAPAERVEEKLGSVDYDIWQCPGCNAVEKIRHGRWFTRYARCPQCGAVTKHSSERTLRSATTMSTGLAEIHEKCGHCVFERTSTRTIPRVSTSSHSSGRSSSSSSGGGGSSSGRGASGRW